MFVAYETIRCLTKEASAHLDVAPRRNNETCRSAQDRYKGERRQRTEAKRGTEPQNRAAHKQDPGGSRDGQADGAYNLVKGDAAGPYSGSDAERCVNEAEDAGADDGKTGGLGAKLQVSQKKSCDRPALWPNGCITSSAGR